jgi:hypothetical protein
MSGFEPVGREVAHQEVAIAKVVVDMGDQDDTSHRTTWDESEHRRQLLPAQLGMRSEFARDIAAVTRIAMQRAITASGLVPGYPPCTPQPTLYNA